jgi:hypothetical protein
MVFPGFLIVQKNLGYLKKLKVAEQGIQKKLVILYTETLPFLDSAIPEPAREGPGVRLMDAQKIHLGKGFIPGPGEGNSIFYGSDPWNLNFPCVHRILILTYFRVFFTLSLSPQL